MKDFIVIVKENLNQAIENLGDIDGWGQVSLFNEEEIEKVIECSEFFERATCCFYTHKSPLVRIKDKSYNKDQFAMMVHSILFSCLEAARARA